VLGLSQLIFTIFSLRFTKYLGLVSFPNLDANTVRHGVQHAGVVAGAGYDHGLDGADERACVAAAGGVGGAGSGGATGGVCVAQAGARVCGDGVLCGRPLPRLVVLVSVPSSP
jgi:hypothetical protein